MPLFSPFSLHNSPSSFKIFFGFTLIEVLVAFSIMSFIMAAVLQSESDTIYIMVSTEFRIKVRKYVEEELLRIERNSTAHDFGQEEGKFEEKHELFGARWIRTVGSSDVLNIQLKKINYEIIWDEQGIEKSLNMYVFAEL